MIKSGIMAFLGPIGGWEVLVILFIILLLFGAKKIPELARGMGKGIREFKDATNEIKDSLEEEANKDSQQTKQGPNQETKNENAKQD